MLKIDIDKCTGCGACVQKCPQKCIFWFEGELGFRYPIIDETLCIDCDQCKKVCPIGKGLKQPNGQRIFAAVHKDKEILKNSTSGGAFSAIAYYVLERQGVIYGCCMNSDMKAMHVRVDKKEELDQLKGSKYIQSNASNTFFQAEDDLKKGAWVLYTGTPCQIAGLYQYLGKHYDRLVTIDIVCHGVGSQAYFDKYINYARKHYGNITELHFRSKEFAGWSCSGVVVVNDKNKIKLKQFNDYNNYYYYYFLKGDIYRRSCYECPYANTIRQGDFSVGDFWGVESYNLEIDSRDGCSLLFVNNDNAQRILKAISTMYLVEVTQEQAVRNNGQLKQPVKKSITREDLMKQYDTLNAEEIQKLFVRNNTKSVIKGFIKALVPYRVKLVVRRWRKEKI